MGLGGRSVGMCCAKGSTEQGGGSMDLGVGGLGQDGGGVKVLGRGCRQPQHRKHNILERIEKSVLNLGIRYGMKIWIQLDTYRLTCVFMKFMLKK